MSERKLDLLVCFGVITVVVVGGFLAAPPPPTLTQVTQAYAEEHWEEIAKVLEGRVCRGMTLQAVWGLRGTPQGTVTDLDRKTVTYAWGDPPLRVTLTMETFPWLVVEVEEGTQNPSGRMSDASPKSLTDES